MFKDIFPNKLNRLVYQQTKKGASKKEVVGAQPQAPSKKPKSDPQAEGKKVMDVAAKKQRKIIDRLRVDGIAEYIWKGYFDNPDMDPFKPGLKKQERMNRLIRAYTVLKELQKVTNSHNEFQKQLRELFVADAVEISLKEVTGRTLLKQLGIYEMVEEVNPKKHESLENLASDFPEFIKLDKKNPSRFTVRVPLRYHNEIGGFVADVGDRGPTTTFEINGNVAKVINSTRRCLFMNDVSLYKLSGALAICRQAKKGVANHGLKAYGKKFHKLMQHPTDTLRQSIKRTEKGKKE